MISTAIEQLTTGDVIEVKTVPEYGDESMTVLVLLVTDDFVILDPCDDSTPFLLRHDELVEYRRFEGD